MVKRVTSLPENINIPMWPVGIFEHGNLIEFESITKLIATCGNSTDFKEVSLSAHSIANRDMPTELLRDYSLEILPELVFSFGIYYLLNQRCVMRF